MDNRIVRPWGYFETLYEEERYKVKKITVLPDQRLSMQYHNKRKESWSVASGKGFIEVNTSSKTCFPGFITYIDKGINHRIKNISKTDNLVIIEVQIGICDEDDIVRLEDDYGRA